MTPSEIEQIKDEIEAELAGLRLGKIFQIDPLSLAIDFFPHSGRYLYLTFAPGIASVYLIRRKLKELERGAAHPTQYAIDLKRRLSGKTLSSVSIIEGSSAMKFEFIDTEAKPTYLLVQLGRVRPGLFVLDEAGIIVAASKGSDIGGQALGDKHEAPVEAPLPYDTQKAGDEGLSDRLDAEDLERRSREQFDRRIAEARRRLNTEIRKRVSLITNLEGDLEKHGDPARWKRYGDLLLANMANIRREGDTIIATDYFDSNMPDVEIPADRNATPSEIAESYFKRYTKARNGADTIAERLAKINNELDELRSKLGVLKAAESSRDDEAISALLPSSERPAQSVAKSKAGKEQVEFRGARRFVSSDGFEILVGKKAVDNDHLTFRVSRSLDTWLHAADYSGSHVIVRNPGRKELPPRTLIEAAQLAAFYSDARELPKAAVRYTLRKFVNKPRKSAPGLVSLSSFKTILVEPKIGKLTSRE